ncbi:translation initiation factor IF-2 subunit alpha [Candidatus Woesearchaeota archaeon]|nr:translation initiation factor IF-2 subunit alpha [Candidatus Woesearchaeota archaeon]
MLYKREGMPQEDEIVLCTVTKVHHHSVFARLDEYNKSGMIHISEVSPGRIRNLRDYVQEGKKVVCKILKIDRKKGHIDLSLRRVNESQRRKKTSEIKQEQKAEKIIEGVAKSLDKEVRKVYGSISEKVFEKYEYIHEFFNDIVADKTSCEKLGIEKNIGEELTKAVKEKIKPATVKIKGILSLTSYDPDGVEKVKSAIKKAEKAGKENITVSYRGSGQYNVIVEADDYKTAEKIIEKSTESAIKYIEKQEGEGEFAKEEA